MSPKFVFAILLPAVLLAVLAIFLKQHFNPVPSAPVASVVPTSPPAPAPDVSPLPVTPPPVAPAPVAKAMTSEDIQAEKDRLSDWEMNNDPQSLSNILADLNSPEKDIRMAAISATVQFNDTNAVPILRNIATNTDDPDEKVALLKAADFLALPDVTVSTPTTSTPLSPEQLQAAQQRHAQYEASKQAHLQRQQQGQGQGQNQNSAAPQPGQ